MDFDSLIAMNLDEAERLLLKCGIDYTYEVIDTFKLTNHDCIKVVALKQSGNHDVALELICARFRRGVRDEK